MPFLVPILAPALVGTIGGALLGAGLELAAGIGLSFAAKKLRPKTKGASASRGTSINLTIDTNPPRQAILGEVATGGSLAYWQLSGTNNDTLHMVIALADHECTSLQGVLVDGKLKTWNSGTGQVAGYGANLVVRFYSGAAGQTADSAVVAASGGRWTANEKGVGLCYVVVELKYDEKLFPGGIPQLAFVVRGAKLLDPRTSTTAYTDNVAIALYNILTGISSGGEKLLGMNVPSGAIRLSEAQAAANACDELVALAAGGTEKRYRCGVVFDATQSNRDMIETLLAAMGGELIAAGGIYRMFAGVAQTPVVSITDDDIISGEPFTSKPKRPRNDLTNAILGSYTDPSRGYVSVAVPPRISSTDELSDGGIRLSKSFDLVAVTSRTQAQRVLELERKRARRMISAGFRIRARYFGLEPGDWVTFSSARRGYSSKTFVVHTTSGNPDLSCDIVLIETDAGIDDWSTSDEVADNQVIDLASAGPPLSALSGVSLNAITVTTSGSVQRPGLQFVWDAVTDPTVDAIEIEYRKVGDTVALGPLQVLDPSAGSYSWVTGVQSGATYEARARMRTRPARGVTWTSWIAAGAASANQVVAVAASATSVPAGTITKAMLDAQAAFELQTAFDAAQSVGSVSDAIAQLSEASVAQSLSLSNLATAINNELTERRNADGVLSQQVASVSTSLNGQQVTVTALQQSVNGLKGQWGIAINANGQAVGLVSLDGSQSQSAFTVVADKFLVAQPGQAGGGATPVFALSRVTKTDGSTVTKLALVGDMVADGTITAQKLKVGVLSALSADFGDAIFRGVMRGGPNSKMIIDLTNGRIRGLA